MILSKWLKRGRKRTTYLYCVGMLVIVLAVLCLVSLVTNASDGPKDESEHLDHWRTVEDGKVFTYSAFLDTRPWSYDANVYVIRIWSILEKYQHASDFHCKLWMGSNKPLVLKANGYRLPEQQSNRYKYFAVEFVCPVPKHTVDEWSREAASVAIVRHQGSESTRTTMQLHMPQVSANATYTIPRHAFTVCLGGPLKYAISDVNRLAEWVEMNNLLGADYFILYNHSAKDTLDNILGYYEKSRKLIEVLPWKLPQTMVNTRRTIKNFGHMALINDCLHRSMYTSEYVVFLDLDEYIIPRQPGVSSWPDLLRSIRCQSSQYIFCNVFFKLQWKDDSMTLHDEDVVKHNLLTQLKTRRQEAVWPHGDWSKYIVKPEHVSLPGIHVAHQMRNATEPCNVDPDDALVHHYRHWPLGGRWTEDRTMHSYREELVWRVQNALQGGIVV